jgi:HlyD family secretion protein
MRLPASPVFIAASVVAALAGGLLLVFAPQPPEVDVHRLSRGPLEVTVEDEGETRVKDLYVVSAPISGQMRRIALEPGDPVVARQTVVTSIEALRPRFYDLRETTEHRAQV